MAEAKEISLRSGAGVSRLLLPIDVFISIKEVMFFGFCLYNDSKKLSTNMMTFWRSGMSHWQGR